MSGTREMLEGEAYWGRIRSIKRKLYTVEIVLIIIMGLVLVVTSKDFSTSPFLFPCEQLLWFLLIMFLIILIEGFIFRIMQLHIAKSDSVKYIMATNSIKRAVIIAIVAAIIAILMLTPGVVQGLEDTFSYRGTATPGHPVRFQNEDLFGLSSVDSVVVHCNGNTEVFLVSQFLVNQYPGDEVMQHPLNDKTLADPDLTIDMTPFAYSNYYIYVKEDPQLGNQTTAEFSLDTHLSATMTTVLPIVAIVFVASNAIWVEYLHPFRKKCKTKSIYK